LTSPVPDEESLAFEDAAVRVVTGGLSAGLAQFISALIAAFEGTLEQIKFLPSEAQGRAIGESIAKRIEGMTWEPMNPRIAQVSISAQTLGVQRTIRRIRKGTSRKARAEAQGYSTSMVKLPDPDARLHEALASAAKLARAGIRTREDMASVAGRINQGRARVEGHARHVANFGLNLGVEKVARRLNEHLLWVPERNACLHCLAHAGYVVKPGNLFPGVSFDPEAKNIPAVPHPPLHPNCRCMAQLTEEKVGAPSRDKTAASKSAALAREARRTVAYQWTDHASGPAAERAAERLLSTVTDLPGSVEQRARRALRKGGVRRPK
jgi:hypothetical protein